jgi:hypothetical protein
MTPTLIRRILHATRPLAVAAAVLPCTAWAQPLRPISLAKANATLDDDFVGLTSMRELADGRVILTDGRDQRIFLADFALGTATPLSRKGKGPLEYSFVGFVYATAADSTIMLDLSNRRWLVFAGASVVGTVPPDNPAVEVSQPMTGADRLGRVLSTKGTNFVAGVRVYTRRDSQVVMLVDRRTGRADSVARVREMPREATKTVDAEGRVTSSSNRATESAAQGEEAFLANDGTLAIIRLEPLRVDWRSPTGTWTRGAPLPITGAAVTAVEREAIVKRRAENAESMRKAGFAAFPDAPIPTTLPALANLRGAIGLPDGRIALQRRSPTSVPSVRYVIVNRKGAIDGEITLAANEQIIGFGARSIYVSFKDADDVQRLRRHAWP